MTAAPSGSAPVGATTPAPSTPDPSEVASKVAARLGSRTAGAYLDARSRPFVSVTREKDAITVRSLGATPRMVPRDGATLTTTSERLRREVRTAGTAWSIDPVTAQVVVQADTTVTGDRLAAVKKVVRHQGKTARLEQVPGRISLFIAGGNAIYDGGGSRCSLGFNVVRNGVYYFLTAGHCTNDAVSWRLSNGTTLGSRAGTSYPGNDYGLVRYTNSRITKSGTVYLYNGTYRDITGPGTPVVGAAVQRSGSTTRVHSGRILGTNAVVNYGDGPVSGMILTSVCAEGGDSGGPLFRGKAALGLTSGGWGDCTNGGETYFQPVTEVLNRYKVRLY